MQAYQGIVIHAGQVLFEQFAGVGSESRFQLQQAYQLLWLAVGEVLTCFELGFNPICKNMLLVIIQVVKIISKSPRTIKYLAKTSLRLPPRPQKRPYFNYKQYFGSRKAEETGAVRDILPAEN